MRCGPAVISSARTRCKRPKRKAENLADLDIAWSVIGHLQTNKAKDVAAFASEFQALDSYRVAEALDAGCSLPGFTCTFACTSKKTRTVF